MKYLLILLVLISNITLAGYKGDDIKEIGKAPDRVGNLLRMYDVDPSVETVNMYPLCMDRLHATYIIHTGKSEPACWWAYGERLFFWSPTNGLVELNTDFVLKNDRYVSLDKRSPENF